MLTLDDGESLRRALKLPIDDKLKTLLRKRRRQLSDFQDLSEIARYVIVEPDDTLAAIERALGFSVFQNPVDLSQFGDPEFVPCWEWITDHDGWFEFVFVFDDSGFGHVVFVADRPRVDARLLALCHTYTQVGRSIPLN